MVNTQAKQTFVKEKKVDNNSLFLSIFIRKQFFLRLLFGILFISQIQLGIVHK